MSDSPVYRPHQESPATARLSPFSPEGAFADVDAYRFEVVSRGDFVPGLLYLPPRAASDPSGDALANPAASAAPLVLVQHGLAGSKESPYLECAARWVREGFAVASIDLPLHGARSSPKLSARLVEGIDQILQEQELDPETLGLVEEFARQSTSDLVRTLDAMTALDAIDASRIGYVGFSLGAVVGSYLLAHDTRPSVAVLALAGGGGGPVDLDPASYIGQGAERPVLVVAADDDKRVSIAASKALFDAARDPKEFLESPGDHGTLSGQTLGRIQTFLKRELDRQALG